MWAIYPYKFSNNSVSRVDKLRPCLRLKIWSKNKILSDFILFCLDSNEKKKKNCGEGEIFLEKFSEYLKFSQIDKIYIYIFIKVSKENCTKV